MPGGGRSSSRSLRVVGAGFAVVAVAGTAFGGWEFSASGDGVVPLVLAVVALVLVLVSSTGSDD